MTNFTYSSIISAPVETVWNFHERPDILELLNPPWQSIKVVRREGGLEVGATSEFKIFVGIIPIKWIAKHVEYEKFRLFADQQIEGPFQKWFHRHEFEPIDANTMKLTDRVEFVLAEGWLIEQISGSWVSGQLQDLFTYRHMVIKRECEKQG
ncbi:cyclase/dehydrase [Thalassoporum mexicanum PCC 7367]|uniref:SRPBCC family protein n=1 Tax=Thalassoporum mexicanum TaxID=3457544 RepID=UPI00029FD0EB|nr:SRPBCC family protein [Pseudanabaena sp. PCC 7367]AFY70137.1 cyclase/dehydrase [Pseudanabaena sp. PCC 7367]